MRVHITASCGDASFLDLDLSSFLADVDCLFFRSISVKNIFFPTWANVFWPNKWEHASFGRKKTSVELAQKNLADLHCTFFMHHQNKKPSCAVKKKTLSASEHFFKKIAQCRKKNISRGYFTTNVGY